MHEQVEGRSPTERPTVRPLQESRTLGELLLRQALAQPHATALIANAAPPTRTLTRTQTRSPMACSGLLSRRALARVISARTAISISMFYSEPPRRVSHSSR
jgi:hypothetical protein